MSAGPAPDRSDLFDAGAVAAKLDALAKSRRGNEHEMRAAICKDLDWFGIALDETRNREAKGEVPIHAQTSRVQLWIMPTNEELIVARQAKQLLASGGR